MSVFQEVTFKDEKEVLESQTVTGKEEFSIPVSFKSNDAILPLYEDLLATAGKAKTANSLIGGVKPNGGTLKTSGMNIM